MVCLRPLSIIAVIAWLSNSTVAGLTHRLPTYLLARSSHGTQTCHFENLVALSFDLGWLVINCSFKSCRLCRRAPNINYVNLFWRFYGVCMFLSTLVVSSDTIVSFYGESFMGWKRSQAYLRDKTDVIPQSGGWDFLATSMFLFSKFTYLIEKVEINTSVQNPTFIMGLDEAVWGKMTVMTVGSFQVFMKIVTSTRVLHVRVHVFQKTSIFIFSV